MSDNEDYIKLIIQKTGLSKKDIQNRVEEKKADLKGLISDEGALFIVAKELGVDIQNQSTSETNKIEINISDITSNMQNINIAGRIKDIFQIKNFTRKDGTVGYVGSFLLHDTTGDIRVTLWDEKTKIMENDYFQKNELVKVLNSYAKMGRMNDIEIHLGINSKVIISPDDVDYKKHPSIKDDFTPINEINLNLKSISISGKILQKFPVREFTKKNGEEGRVASIIMGDATGSSSITFWNEDIEKLNNFNIGNFVSITSLYPKQNYRDPQTIDLNFGRSSQIKIEKEVKPELKQLENKFIKIEKIKSSKGVANFQGKIIQIDNLRDIKSKKTGETFSLLGFVVSDETDAIRVTMWGEEAEKYSEILEIGDIVSIKNSSIRYSTYSSTNEITFVPGSELEKIDLKIPNAKDIDHFNLSKQTQSPPGFSGNYKKISDISSPGNYEIKGTIAKEITQITIYDACPKCWKKIDNCTCEEKQESIPRIILNLTLDDESGTIRVSFIGELAEKILGSKTSDLKALRESPEFENYLKNISEKLVGKEIILRGRGKYSDYNDRYELNAYDFKEIDPIFEIDEIFKQIDI